MQINVEDIKTILSLAAFGVSLLSLYFSRINWIQSNRPVVSAFVSEHASGNMAATFNLTIANTGNRPAVHVRLHASHADISSLLEDGVALEKFKAIESPFDAESEVPLLKNGEELSTSFGAFLGNSQEGPWLKYGAKAKIAITYEDLDGRKYESQQPIKVFARNGFGGGIWK